jgi:GntR family transcriptional regulator
MASQPRTIHQETLAPLALPADSKARRQNVFLSKLQVDRSSPVPIYHQIKEKIIDAIAEEVLYEGDPIPSERELVRHLNVSRMTVRRALNELSLRGDLLTRPGKGTYVHGRKVQQRLAHLAGLSADMARSGHTTSSKVLRAEVISADGKIAERLQLGHGEAVIVLERLRAVDGEPTCWERAYLPEKLCPDLLRFDFSQRSLYNVLQIDYGLTLQHGWQSMEAVPSNWREQQLLHIPEGAPVFLAERVVLTDTERVIEYSKASFRGDRYRYEVQLIGDHNEKE